MESRFNIVSLFIRAAEIYPHKTAIIEGGKQISYGELVWQMKQTAGRFEKRGIKKGDRVLLFLPMGIALYRNILALLYIGATIVFVDQWSDKRRLDACCEIADCKAFVGSWKAHLLRFISKGIRRIPLKFVPSYIKGDLARMCETFPEDSALITFTTGSTGAPKAAVRTHGFLHEQFKALQEEVDTVPSDIDMSVLPIVLLINLAVGSTSVIARFNPSRPIRIKPRQVVRQLQRHQVSRIVASPYFVLRVATYLRENRISLPDLRAVFTGGAPVFLKEAKLFGEVFSGKEVRVLYGSTEAEPISSINISELANDVFRFDLKQGIPVGRVYRKALVKIIQITDGTLFDLSAEEFAAVQQPEGVWGEIIVSGPHVLTRYFRGESSFRANKILVDGTYWHRTGDSGYVQGDRIFLTGRCHTLIPYDGRWISPFVFENFVQSIEGVELGTILSRDGDIAAFIELRDDNKANRQQVVSALSQLPIPIASVSFQQIPRDPRHHSKIAYSLLK